MSGRLLRASWALAVIGPIAGCGGSDAAEPVLTGLDVLVERDFAPLRGRRLGLVLHRASIARDGRRTDLVLLAAGLDLVRLFTPEHGLDSDREGSVAGGVDAASGLPIVSLYGDTRAPTATSLADLDVLVFDLQDAGARFYTYLSTLGLCLEACAAAGVDVLVLDRPNPIGGVAVEGPVLDTGRESFVGWHPLPVRHGMTLGELALLFDRERGIGARPAVVRLSGWRREMQFEDTGLAWVPPSPNLPDPAACRMYPGTALIEFTNVSVGRGTPAPFRLVGAPWIEPDALVWDLNGLGLSDVWFGATDFVPMRGPFAGERCRGVEVYPTERGVQAAVDVGLALAWALRQNHADDWDPEGLDRLLADERVYAALLAGASLDELRALWQDELAEFRSRRDAFLLYDGDSR